MYSILCQTYIQPDTIRILMSINQNIVVYNNIYKTYHPNTDPLNIHIPHSPYSISYYLYILHTHFYLNHNMSHQDTHYIHYY